MTSDNKWQVDPAYKQLKAGEAHADDQPFIAEWIERLHARIAHLEAENSALAADQCHAGYAGENGDHRCREVDKARAQIAALVKALEPFVKEADRYGDDDEDTGWNPLIRHFRRARAVIADLRAAMADPAQDDVERVARAICKELGHKWDELDGGWHACLKRAARAALAAMTPAPVAGAPASGLRD